MPENLPAAFAAALTETAPPPSWPAPLAALWWLAKDPSGRDPAAWERAHAHYLGQFTQFSDIQDERPLPLTELEAACGCC